ncbi:phage tail-collar fiber domain-containing protein [Pseudomonas sp. RT4P38]
MVNANSLFGGMLTTLGAAKKTNCDALGIPWEPRYMLIGDANGTDPVPNPAQTQLVNQVYRAQINQLYVSPTDANILIAELVLPPDVGGWWIRELALEDKDGVFCAVANAAPSYKPLLAQGSGRNQVVRMHIITSGTANIQLKIDPSVVLATRQYVDVTINGLLPANKVVGTYTKVTVNDRGVFVSGSNPTTLAGMGITDTFTKAEIESMIAQASALPVGTNASFSVNKIPPGFLERDGSVKSIAAYPDLAEHLGGAFNRGDEGAGNFRLPETRGEYERGWDHGRGVDAGRAVGSWQKATGVYPLVGSDGNVLTVNLTDTDGALNPVPHPSYTLMTKTANYSTMPVASQFVRTRNVAVVMCIKAWNAPINQGNIDIAALAALAAQATEINQGTAKIATQALTDAGVDDTTIITPKKLRWGVVFSIGQNGYVAFPSWLGGWIIQWGSATDNQPDAVNWPLPMAFPTAIYKVIPVMRGALDGAQSMNCYWDKGATSLTTVRVGRRYANNGGAVAVATQGYEYIAIGK